MNDSFSFGFNAALGQAAAEGYMMMCGLAMFALAFVFLYVFNRIDSAYEKYKRKKAKKKKLKNRINKNGREIR